MSVPYVTDKSEKGIQKIYQQIKKSLYNWTLNYSQVMQSPIINDGLKVKIDGYTEPQLVPKLLWQVSVRKLHKKLVSDTKFVRLK